MWSSSIVEVEPGGKSRAALLGATVNRAVGPAAEHRADEALRLPIRARPVGPGAQVLEPERLAGECVDDGAVTGAVVGHHPLNTDAVGAVVGDGAAEEASRRGRLLVAEHLDVGDPGGVVDADVDVLPADPAASCAAVAVDAVAGPTDPAKLLDVDVQELARSFPLIAVCWLGRFEPRQLPEPDPGQHRRHCRERHLKRLGDLGGRHPQTPQRRDQLNALLRRPTRHPLRCRGPINEPIPAFAPEASEPLRDRAYAHAGGLGRLRERPALPEHALNDQPATVQTGAGVTVQPHSGPSLDWVASTPPASKEARMEQRCWELQLDRCYSSGTSCLARSTTCCGSNGLPMKPSAPRRVASTASSSSTLPLNMITGIEPCRSCMRWSISQPSVPGMTTSSSTRSGA